MNSKMAAFRRAVYANLTSITDLDLRLPLSAFAHFELGPAFVLVSPFVYFCFWLVCYHTVNVSVHVKLSYRIILYSIV